MAIQIVDVLDSYPSNPTSIFWQDQLINSQQELEQYLKWLDCDPNNRNLQMLAKSASDQIKQLTQWRDEWESIGGLK